MTAGADGGSRPIPGSAGLFRAPGLFLVRLRLLVPEPFISAMSSSGFTVLDATAAGPSHCRTRAQPSRLKNDP